jgi:hypothetical protein
MRYIVPGRRFTILPCSTGFEIIDVESGHPVDKRPYKAEARGLAHDLNQAAEAGSRTLAVALTALSDPRVLYDERERQLAAG